MSKIALTNAGEPCKKCTEADGLCGVHGRMARDDVTLITEESQDGGKSSRTTQAGDEPHSNGIRCHMEMPDGEWFKENHMAIHIMNGKTRDDVQDMENPVRKAAKTFAWHNAGRIADDRKAGYVAVFGRCENPDCDRGAAGFDSDHCTQCEPDTNDGQESQDGEQMTVTIDGREVTGDKDTIMALLEDD